MGESRTSKGEGHIRDSKGKLPAFVLGIDRFLLFAVEGKGSEDFLDGRK